MARQTGPIPAVLTSNTLFAGSDAAGDRAIADEIGKLKKMVSGQVQRRSAPDPGGPARN